MAEGRWSGRSRHRADHQRGSHREPLAVGWGAGDATTRGTTVVAAFDNDRLGDGLARLHGSGFGPSARVLDERRGDLHGQLTRAGLPSDLAERLTGARPARSTSLLVVHAPARSGQVVELLGRSGAFAIEVVLPTSASAPTASPAIELASDAPLADAGV